ncbi:MAG: putative type VIII secretion system protein [Prokaryotic dsDNA virus sp.]|nr:MAG: putative type VIII secretion system protein [Prokaryotic dsDNA virus sp.]|tara:strand:- start:157 stop:654 length:498 start_codon:yes stop_codon:yes gene_type:complete
MTSAKISLLFLALPVMASELVHQFGNPSFSGINQSAHYLTVDEQERTRTEKIASDIQDKLDEEAREADNTVLARFVRNLESRIYSTLAKDLSESLFNYDGIPTSENPIVGEISLEGNILRWVNDGSTITLTVEEWFDGVLVSTTEIVIPVGDFGGCWTECDSGDA